MDITALLSSELLTRPTGNTAAAEGGDFADVMGNLLAKAGQAEQPMPPVGARPLATALGAGSARLMDTPLPPHPVLAQALPVTRGPAGELAPIGPATETESADATAKPPTDQPLAAVAPPITPIPTPGTQQPRDDAVNGAELPEDQGALAPAAPATLPTTHNPALAPAATAAAGPLERPVSEADNRPAPVANAAAPSAVSTRAVPGAQAPAQPALAEAAISETAQAANLAADAGTRAAAEASRFTRHGDAELARPGADAPAAMEAPGGNRPASLANTTAQASGPVNAATMAQISLSAPVTSPAWQQQLGQQLGSITQHGRHQVELHLNPADLGPLSVTLKVDDAGAQAQFLSAHATVRTAVEQAIPQLREALAEQGITLGETSVGEQQRQAGGEAGNGEHNRTAARDNTADMAVDAAPEDAPRPPLMTGPGVDLYA